MLILTIINCIRNIVISLFFFFRKFLCHTIYDLPYQSSLSINIANKVFDVLTKYKLIKDIDRTRHHFIVLQSNPNHICTEYRLSCLCLDDQKFWNTSRKFYISENIGTANEELAEVYLEHCNEIATKLNLI